MFLDRLFKKKNENADKSQPAENTTLVPADSFESSESTKGFDPAEAPCSSDSPDPADSEKPERSEHAKKKKLHKKKIPATAYIDTEFNAFDYYGQNGGKQEILEIGAVVMRGGKRVGSFKSFCALKEGHVLSKRSTKLTGIVQKDIKGAPAFPDVLDKFNEFLDRFHPANVFVYGGEDRLQMTNTAKLYNIKSEQLRYVDQFNDNMKFINAMLGLKKKSNLTLSVKDLCNICEVEAEQVHDALKDAEYLAECSEKIKRREFTAENVDLLIEKKEWNSHYRMSRRVKEGRDTLILKDEDLLPVKELIEKLRKDGQYPDYLLQAIYDDLLMTTGRPPEGDI